jgi:hypothetical protein
MIIEQLEYCIKKFSNAYYFKFDSNDSDPVFVIISYKNASPRQSQEY